jgi:LPXTG-motif cell wall-anchored protein
MVQRLMVLCGAVLVLIGAALPVAAQSNAARVRVVHAAEQVPAVDVFLDGKAVLENVGFVSVSDYLEVPAGAHKVALAPTGQGEAAALISKDVTVEAGKAYTVAGVGRDEGQLQVYSDDLSVPPAGKARVRTIHTLPDAPSVDVEEIGGPRIFENITFPNASNYAEVNAKTYSLQLVANGANTVFKQWPNREYESSTIYDVIVFGSLANLQTRVAITKPTASNVGGSAPANAVAMPDTGVASSFAVLAGMGMLLMAAGLVSRRRWA